ncbi:MAG: hypothetical protein IH991_05770 [Planctomycetes bacterium]|nr:hypothetical protein [Planctomycetota bacterium]
MIHSYFFKLPLGVVLVTLLGCGSSLPEVKGKVVLSTGEPFPGGSIEFRSVNDSSLTIMGQIKKDGSFTLRTLGVDGAVDGAAPGSYHVEITPMLEGDQTQVGEGVSAAPIVLNGTYEIKASDPNLTITVP